MFHIVKNTKRASNGSVSENEHNYYRTQCNYHKQDLLFRNLIYLYHHLLSPRRYTPHHRPIFTFEILL